MAALDDFMKGIANHPGAEALLSALPLAAGSFMLARPNTTLGTPIGAVLTGLGGFGTYQGLQGINEQIKKDQDAERAKAMASLAAQANPAMGPQMSLPAFNQLALKQGVDLDKVKALDEAAGYTGATKQRLIYDEKRGGLVDPETKQFTPIKNLPALPQSNDPKTLAQLDLANAAALFPNDKAKQAEYVAQQENSRRLALAKSEQPLMIDRAVAQGKAMIPVEESKQKALDEIKQNTPAARLEQQAKSIKSGEDLIKFKGQVYDTYIKQPGVGGTLKAVLGGNREATVRAMRPVRDPSGAIAGFMLPGGQVLWTEAGH